MRAGTPYISSAQLPADEPGGRRGSVDLLVRSGDGYVPVLVVRHKLGFVAANACIDLSNAQESSGPSTLGPATKVASGSGTIAFLYPEKAGAPAHPDGIVSYTAHELRHVRELTLDRSVGRALGLSLGR